MFHSPRLSGRLSGRYRTGKNHSLELQNFLLRFRRVRRVCHRHIVIFARVLIVLFAILELQPAAGHFDDDIWPFLSRLNVFVGFLASTLAIIYFDVRVFNFVIVASIIVEFFFDVRFYGLHSIPHLLAYVTFHSTAVLFSTFVGRRRSIVLPQVFKNCHSSRNYLANLRSIRYVDILEAGIRLQVSILVIDYSLSASVGATGFMFTVPFVGLFLAGYCTQWNGIVVLLLLFLYATTNGTSPILDFSLTKCVSTLVAASLSLSVGPGCLTVDEWLASKSQLCY